MNSTKRALKQQRQFFVLIILALSSFGVWKTLKDANDTAYILFSCAAGLAFLEFVLHPVAKAIFKGWMAFAHVLGRIQTTLLTTLIYYLMIVPISLISRWNQRNKESFETIAKRKGSAFVPAAPPSTKENYYKQF